MQEQLKTKGGATAQPRSGPEATAPPRKKRTPGARMKLSQRIRMWVAICFTAITNGYLSGFAQGQIYGGPIKMACVPGLNCYACPGALGSCPIGALQNSLASFRHRPSLTVIGFLLAFGAICGRFVCGWLCPIGLFQDLMFKIKTRRKYKVLPGHRWLRHFKYLILAVMVVLLPLLVLNIVGLGQPWFCKYVCPSGVIMGGWPLSISNPMIRDAVGLLFSWKSFLAVAMLVGGIFLYRPFCKYICPLGAIYGLFNRIALFRLFVDRERCIDCGACERVCPMDIKVRRNPNSVECIRCGRCVAICPTDAIEVVPLKRKAAGCEGCSSCKGKA